MVDVYTFLISNLRQTAPWNFASIFSEFWAWNCLKYRTFGKKTGEKCKNSIFSEQLLIFSDSYYCNYLKARKVRVYKFSRQNFSQKLIFANFANLKKICFRDIFWKAVFREILENMFSRNFKNLSYAKLAKLFSHKDFNAWKSSILRYLRKLILGQN